MRILVCGSRHWDDAATIHAVLFGLTTLRGADPELTVISGMARGADTHAAEWAEAFGAELLEFPAEWDQYGRAAGPIRNQAMLDEGKPDVVWAFHDDLAASKGTADMARRAKKAGVPVYVVGRA